MRLIESPTVSVFLSKVLSQLDRRLPLLESSFSNVFPSAIELKAFDGGSESILPINYGNHFMQASRSAFLQEN